MLNTMIIAALLLVIAIFALLAGFFLIIAAVRQSRTMLRIGLLILIIPILLYIFTVWYF